MAEPTYLNLASYRACVARLRTAWPKLLETRNDRLRHGDESEKVAEAIIEDLLTGVLDWDKGDLAYQLEYADIVLSQNLQKHLVIEVKKPGTLRLGRQSLATALEQARRYADAQHITRVAVTDGCIFMLRTFSVAVCKTALRFILVVLRRLNRSGGSACTACIARLKERLRWTPLLQTIRPPRQCRDCRKTAHCSIQNTNCPHTVLPGLGTRINPEHGNCRI